MSLRPLWNGALRTLRRQGPWSSASGPGSRGAQRLAWPGGNASLHPPSRAAGCGPGPGAQRGPPHPIPPHPSPSAPGTRLHLKLLQGIRISSQMAERRGGAGTATGRHPRSEPAASGWGPGAPGLFGARKLPYPVPPGSYSFGLGGDRLGAARNPPASGGCLRLRGLSFPTGSGDPPLQTREPL